MGAVRLVRTLALLALMAGLVAGCGSGSSSTPAADPVQSLEPGDSAPTDAATGLPTTGTTAGLELRPVYARYASGVPLELGPAAPKDLVKTLSQHACPSPASQLQGMQLECDAGKTVYLLKDPIVTGGVATATAKQIGHKKLWFVEVQLDQQASDQLAAATGQSSGTELAMSFDGTVLTAPVLFKPITDGSFAITGNYNQKQATRLASQLSTG
jgi:preprotein translocase subunit SecD